MRSESRSSRPFVRVAGNEGPGYEWSRTTTQPHIPVRDRSLSIVVAEIPRGDRPVFELHAGESPEPRSRRDMKRSGKCRQQEPEANGYEEHEEPSPVSDRSLV